MASLAVPGLKPEEVNDMKAAFTIFEANLRGAIQKSTLSTFYKKIEERYFPPLLKVRSSKKDLFIVH